MENKTGIETTEKKKTLTMGPKTAEIVGGAATVIGTTTLCAWLGHEITEGLQSAYDATFLAGAAGLATGIELLGLNGESYGDGGTPKLAKDKLQQLQNFIARKKEEEAEIKTFKEQENEEKKYNKAVRKRAIKIAKARLAKESNLKYYR